MLHHWGSWACSLRWTPPTLETGRRHLGHHNGPIAAERRLQYPCPADEYVCVWLRVSELAANAGFPPDRSGITEVAGPGGPFCTTMSWEDIEWMSGVTELPIVLKGVSSPLDAALAAKMNVEGGAVAGIVISNHGGRNLDGAIGTADALARCAAVSAH